MVFKVKRNWIGFHRYYLLIADGEAILLALVEHIRKIIDKFSELLNGAVGFLIIAQLASGYGILGSVLATFGLRNDVIDGHIIEIIVPLVG